MKVLIGTKNPGKIEGAIEAFKNYFEDFEIEGISVSSDVGEEPVNNEIYATLIPIFILYNGYANNNPFS